jgi:signal transduction histidine kinase
LVVADNGRGFDPGAAAHHAGLGLTGMRERARLVRGRIALQSAPGKGTRIEVNVAVPVIDLDGR